MLTLSKHLAVFCRPSAVILGLSKHLTLHSPQTTLHITRSPLHPLTPS